MSAARDTDSAAGLKFPKPEGALDKEWECAAGRMFAHVDVTSSERKLLQHIAEFADELVVARGIHHDNWAATWLVVPMPAHLLELLHAFETDLDDLEEGEDREPEIAELDTADDEPNGDDEPFWRRAP